MSQKERQAVVAELRGELAVHDQVAAAALKSAARHLRRASAIERELERLEKPKRSAGSRVAFA